MRGGTPRKLGLWMSAALVVGNMVGSGIFLLPASLGRYGGIGLLGWLGTSTGAILLALVFARLSRVVPRAGGPYAYTRAGFGDLAGFLVAWGYWVSVWVSNAAIAVAMVSYLSVFWPGLGNGGLPAALLALTAVWTLTVVNVLGVRRAGSVQVVTTVLKLLPLIAIATLGFLVFQPAHFVPLNVSTVQTPAAVGITMSLTLFAFLGLESATVPAESVERPERVIPRATVIGTLVVAVLYIASTAAVMGILRPEVLASSSAPFADAARTMWGEWAGTVVAAGAVVSCFGALNGWILLQGQVSWAAARDGVMPPWLARLSGRGTPARGLVVSSALVTVLVLANYTERLTEQFTFTVLLATLTALVPYAFVSMAAVVLRLRAPEPLPRGALARALAVPLLAFAYAFLAIAGAGAEAVYWGFLLIIGGLPVYALSVWRHRVREQAGTHG